MREKQINRRDFLRLSAGLTTGAILAACQPAAPEIVEVVKEVPVEKEVVKEIVKEVPVEKVVEKVVKETVVVEKEVAKPVEKVAVEWWEVWGGNVADALQDVADVFNEESETIHVNRLVVRETDKIMAAVAAGTPPDIFMEGVALWAQGMALPVDSWLESSDIIKKDDFPPSYWSDASWRGRTYGIPAIENYVQFGLAYNGDLAKEAGLDPDNPPLDWDEVLEWHEKINKFDEVGNLKILGFDPMGDMAQMAAGPPHAFFWAQSFGFQWWDSQGMAFNKDERLIEVLDTIKRFYDPVGPEKIEGYRSSHPQWTHGPTASMPSGVQGLAIQGYWTPQGLYLASPDTDWRYTWSPTSSDRKGTKFTNVGGWHAIIARGAKQPDAGFEFVEFLTTDKPVDIIYAQTGCLIGRYSYLQKFDVSQTPGIEFYIKSVTEADEIIPCGGCPIKRFADQAWAEAVDAVKFGNKTSKQAAEDFTDLCAEELERQMPNLAT